MSEENNTNQEMKESNPELFPSQHGKQTNPRIVNKINVHISGNDVHQVKRGFQLDGKHGRVCRLRNSNRAGMRVFGKNFPHFVLTGLAPEEERTLLEGREKWLQAQLAAVQKRLGQFNMPE